MKNILVRNRVLRHTLVLCAALAAVICADVVGGSIAATVVGLAFQLWCALGPADNKPTTGQNVNEFERAEIEAGRQQFVKALPYIIGIAMVATLIICGGAKLYARYAG